VDKDALRQRFSSVLLRFLCSLASATTTVWIFAGTEGRSQERDFENVTLSELRRLDGGASYAFSLFEPFVHDALIGRRDRLEHKEREDSKESFSKLLARQQPIKALDDLLTREITVW